MSLAVFSLPIVAIVPVARTNDFCHEHFLGWAFPKIACTIGSDINQRFCFFVSFLMLSLVYKSYYMHIPRIYFFGAQISHALLLLLLGNIFLSQVATTSSIDPAS